MSPALQSVPFRPEFRSSRPSSRRAVIAKHITYLNIVSSKTGRPRYLFRTSLTLLWRRSHRRVLALHKGVTLTDRSKLESNHRRAQSFDLLDESATPLSPSTQTHHAYGNVQCKCVCDGRAVQNPVLYVFVLVRQKFMIVSTINHPPVATAAPDPPE